MQKFTVFTVVLSIVVIVIVADLVVNNYLPGLSDANVLSDLNSGEFKLPSGIDTSKAMETNVLGADTTTDFQTNHLGFDLEKSATDSANTQTQELSLPSDMETPVARTETPATAVAPTGSDEIIPVADDTTKPDSTTTTATPTTGDFEDTGFTTTSTKNIFLRDEQIKSAGFVSAYMEDEKYDGSIYKTIYTDDLFDVSVKKIVIRTKDAMLAKVYIVSMGPSTSLDEVYNVFKVRGAEGLDSEINETNDFGDGSFYMNDVQRPKTAFLTVKIGNLIYGFSYPKEYHPQIANLIKLLMWEK